MYFIALTLTQMHIPYECHILPTVQLSTSDGIDGGTGCNYIFYCADYYIVTQY